MQEAMDISKRIWAAMQQEDADTLTETIHPGAVFVHMGVTLTRDAEIDVIKNQRIVYKTVDFESSTVHEFDTTVVLLNKLKLTAVVGGNEVTNPFVVTEVYSRTSEGLKLVSLSYTRIVY